MACFRLLHDDDDDDDDDILRYDTIVAWCTLKYKIKNRPVAYYRVSKSYVVLGNARVKK